MSNFFYFPYYSNYSEYSVLSEYFAIIPNIRFFPNIQIFIFFKKTNYYTEFRFFRFFGILNELSVSYWPTPWAAPSSSKNRYPIGIGKTIIRPNIRFKRIFVFDRLFKFFQKNNWFYRLYRIFVFDRLFKFLYFSKKQTIIPNE